MVKIALIVFLAHFLTLRVSHINELQKGILIPLLVTGLLAGMIVIQPDFGTTAILVGITLLMIYLAGGRLTHLAGLAALFLPVAVWMLVHKSYRLARLMTFLDPWKDPRHSGFQIIQSLISFGSGGAFGVGIGDGMQKLFYLPEPHTDFILLGHRRRGGIRGRGPGPDALHGAHRPGFPDFHQGAGNSLATCWPQAHDHARPGGLHQHCRGHGLIP
jgi:cell division protein FtsW